VIAYHSSDGIPDGDDEIGVPPGSADLTLKIKDVDPHHFPKGLAS
jgi:hypothetical protein